MRNITRVFLLSLIVAILTVAVPSALSQTKNPDPDIGVIVQTVENDVKYPNWQQYGPIEVSIDHVARSGDYVMIGWHQGHVGGTKILHKRNGVWKVVAGDGGVIYPPGLKEVGINIPDKHANELWRQWAGDEN